MQFGKFWVPHFQTKPCKLTKILLCSAWWRGFCPWPGGLAPGTNSTGTSSSGREFCWGDGQLLNLQQTPVAWWLIRGYAIPYSWHYHHDGNRLLPYWWRKVAIPRTIAPRGSMVESMSPLGWSTAPSSPWRGKTFREAQLWHEFLLKYLFDGNARMDAVAQYRWMVLFYRDPTHTRMMVVMIGSPLVYQNWLPWAKAKAEEHCQHAEEGLGMLTFYQPWWKEVGTKWPWHCGQTENSLEGSGSRDWIGWNWETSTSCSMQAEALRLAQRGEDTEQTWKASG